MYSLTELSALENRSTPRKENDERKERMVSIVNGMGSRSEGEK